MSDPQLLQVYVDRHNIGVESGDFSSMIDLFSPDAELLFVAHDIGPFQGRTAIDQAFKHHPPSNKLIVRNSTQFSSGVSAEYEWESNPGVRAGTI